MEPNWAADHLQVIRTLMERSALYRRALAPIMIVAGGMGLAAAIGTCFIKIEQPRNFSAFWLGVALVGAAASFLLVRRQALKEAEPFWSVPTRRVSRALLPAFLVGLVGGLVFLLNETLPPSANWFLAVFWTVMYGCALHAAGFFMQRGIRLFGWGFIVGGSIAFIAGFARPDWQTAEAAHYVMGVFFGALHLAYGVYLYFTERSREVS
jgi:hypothetical protein